MDVSCSLPVTACPLCRQDHSAAVPFNRVVECGVEWRCHICRNCGLVYQSPQMDDAEIARFYAADYWALYGQEDVPDDWQTKLQQGRAEHLLSLLPGEAKVVRCLDVGCGGGFILREARKRFGGTIVGVEPNDRFREFSRGEGFEVHASVDALIDAMASQSAGGTPTPQKFDCITMSHVLEHFREPVAILKQLREKLLAPDGHLVIEVPNLYAHKSFEPSHPICFNDTTLQATLAAAGYTTQQLLLHNHPRTDVEGPLNISAVSVPAPVPTAPAYTPPNVWFERVKRAYLSKRGAWWRRVWKSLRVGVVSLFVSDLEY